MISHTALAKKGNDMLAEVGLKVRRIERCWIGATLHAVNVNSRIDLTPVGDVATENRPRTKFAKCAWQQDEEADDACGDKTTNDDESPGRWLGRAFNHRMRERRQRFGSRDGEWEASLT